MGWRDDGYRSTITRDCAIGVHFQHMTNVPALVRCSRNLFNEHFLVLNVSDLVSSSYTLCSQTTPLRTPGTSREGD